MEIPEIGLGTWDYRGGVEPLKIGISLGASLIDTAEMYRTEEVVGRAISSLDRRSVFIATKVWPNHLHHDDLLKAAEASLRRLNIKTIDLYQIHWPNPEVEISESIGAMEELVRMGKVRFIGVSNFSVEQVEEAQDALSSEKIVSNQVEYNLSDRRIERDLLPYAISKGMTIIAYSPLERGSSLRNRGRVSKLLDEIASKYKKTRAQVILNWITSKQNVVAIPKADRGEHVRENCGASGWRLSPEDLREIDEEDAKTL